MDLSPEKTPRNCSVNEKVLMLGISTYRFFLCSLFSELCLSIDNKRTPSYCSFCVEMIIPAFIIDVVYAKRIQSTQREGEQCL